MAHGSEEAGLGRIRLFGRTSRHVERLLLVLAVGNVAHHRHHLGFECRLCSLYVLERPATHLNPDEIPLPTLIAAARRIAPEAKLDASRLAAARGIGQRG